MTNNIQVLPFSVAYDSYYDVSKAKAALGSQILEVGGGAHPSLQQREGLVYTIVDPDISELEKAPSDICRLQSTVQQVGLGKAYDLVLSKMVLEHVSDPQSFHESVFALLKPGGCAIHFFACRNSLPALVNRLLPEWMSDAVLRMISNRDLKDQPKYEAFYRRTMGPNEMQIRYFEQMGYEVEKYYGFVGHSYLKRLPVLASIERLYTRVLSKLQLTSLTTVALLVLKKRESTSY